MIGPPGAGKSMLAKRLPSCSRRFSPSRCWRCLAGDLAGGRIGRTRPFRAPHHSASMAALVGGGTRPRPGEVALAHLGVLFLDELPEFAAQVLDALRQPLEAGETVIARANHRISYPSRIQLIAAMNPCRCGRAGQPGYACRQGRGCVERYQARISGPLLDRIDLQIEVPAVSAADLVLPAASEGSAEVRARVTAARTIQAERSQASSIRARAPMPIATEACSRTSPVPITPDAPCCARPPMRLA
jgi:magnesium chelatase family protein